MGKGSVTQKPIKIDISKQVESELEKIGSFTADRIQELSPYRSGEYGQGWTSKVESNGKTVAIYNKGKKASLTHLLELGHRAKDGSTVAPIEHIRIGYNQGKKEYLKSMKNIKLKAGGM
ncbi:HK97 gp10 family phage protein [Carnobacterium divergens]|uniref:HK97 gp10 family phage protein n=1 Tax=Carnobacterium divergens TaxID=2748 RepID=A0AAW8RBH7_CARDV|nr:HK97 gp10 family phage protein [Carnobacterium divergens]MDT1959032.1 HK97 gp10 family phage protein [Carnobacterium divergens]MDT1975141.1 HK97 gp10 family phage protein [Carnobacterium divergens]